MMAQHSPQHSTAQHSIAQYKNAGAVQYRSAPSRPYPLLLFLVSQPWAARHQTIGKQGCTVEAVSRWIVEQENRHGAAQSPRGAYYNYCTLSIFLSICHIVCLAAQVKSPRRVSSVPPDQSNRPKGSLDNNTKNRVSRELRGATTIHGNRRRLAHCRSAQLTPYVIPNLPRGTCISILQLPPKAEHTKGEGGGGAAHTSPAINLGRSDRPDLRGARDGSLPTRLRARV